MASRIPRQRLVGRLHAIPPVVRRPDPRPRSRGSNRPHGPSWTPHGPGLWVEYTAQPEIESDSIERSALDEIFLGLLRRAGARDLREVESYA